MILVQYTNFSVKNRHGAHACDGHVASHIARMHGGPRYPPIPYSCRCDMGHLQVPEPPVI